MTMMVRCANCGSVFARSYVVSDASHGRIDYRCPVCRVCWSLVDVGDDEGPDSPYQKKFEIAQLAIDIQKDTMYNIMEYSTLSQVQSLKAKIKRLDRAVDELAELLEKEGRP